MSSQVEGVLGVSVEGQVLLVTGGKTSLVAYKVTSADKSGSHVIIMLIVVLLVLCGCFFSARS